MTESQEVKSAGQAAPHWILRLMARIHPLLNKLSGGRAFNTLAGVETCFITMTGAKTGKKRIVPLLHLPHGDGVILVASQTGRPENPAWYANLRKNPDIEVAHRGDITLMRAREVSDDEKPELWEVCEAVYPEFKRYRARTTRNIPMFLCRPVEQ